MFSFRTWGHTPISGQLCSRWGARGQVVTSSQWRDGAGSWGEGVRLDASSHEEQQARTVSLGISWGTGGGAFLLPWFLGAGILSALVHSRLQ